VLSEGQCLLGWGWRLQARPSKRVGSRAGRGDRRWLRRGSRPQCAYLLSNHTALALRFYDIVKFVYKCLPAPTRSTASSARRSVRFSLSGSEPVRRSWKIVGCDMSFFPSPGLCRISSI
jgi:hypothetical protein